MKRMDSAHFGKRILAYLIDTGISLGISMISLWLFADFSNLSGGIMITWPALGFFYLLNSLFFCSFLKWQASSPGKLLFGLVVIGSESEPLAWKQIILRPLLGLILGVTISIIPQAIAFFRTDRRQLTDLLLKTQVVERDRTIMRKPRYIFGIFLMLLGVLSVSSNFHNYQQFKWSESGFSIQVKR